MAQTNPKMSKNVLKWYTWNFTGKTEKWFLKQWFYLSMIKFALK